MDRNRPLPVTQAAARRIWLRAQRLDQRAPFGAGPAATAAAVAHLGYVQIDTIHVIERCHHHILYARIPEYQRADLAAAQSQERSVFEYWTHALAYVPSTDFRFFRRDMREGGRGSSWYAAVSPAQVRAIVRRIETEGPLSIRDIDDDQPMEKDHPWASRKPSKRALELAFFRGLLTVSARAGMVKTYELMDRNFGWETAPKAASEAEIAAYKLDRAIRAQGIVTLDSICHLDAPTKPRVRALIEARVARGTLRPVAVEGIEKGDHWADPAMLEPLPPLDTGGVHILSPFDPLIIQRKRLSALFGYDHRFEAYVPREKRVMGYFALPVLVGDEIVAAIDLKTDRAAGRLLIQRWTWVGSGTPARHQHLIEAALDRFGQFQLART
jgi:hypothetical protein